VQGAPPGEPRHEGAACSDRLREVRADAPGFRGGAHGDGGMSKAHSLGNRYRCPFAGWSGVVVDLSPRGDVLIVIDTDNPDRPGSVGKEVWRRLDVAGAWLSEVRA